MQLDNSLLELLVPNLTRLNEQDEESDRTGVFNILGIFENILSFIPPLAVQVVETTQLLPWLLQRIARERAYDSNKQYATEILAILLQEERQVRLKFVELKGVDVTLEAVAVSFFLVSLLSIDTETRFTCSPPFQEYRQKDPADSEEVEYMENLFNTLCSALAEPEAKQAFIDAEGVELMVLIMKDKKAAKTRAIKVLDYACQTDTEEGKKCGERFVEAMGLKTLFPVFMGKVGISSARAFILDRVVDRLLVHRPATRNQKRHQRRPIRRSRTKNTSCPSFPPFSPLWNRTRCLESDCLQSL